MTLTKEERLQIAQTIMEQLGGNRFYVMTGSKAPMALESGVSFKVGSNPKGVTHVRIILTANDDYTMEFLKIRGTTLPKVQAKVEGVYNDKLQEIFTEHTGLYTKF